jgi:serine/threonine protein kinase
MHVPVTAKAYFVLCSALGRMLRSARYSKTRIVGNPGVREVRKRRSFYAPLLIWMGVPLGRVLDIGLRVLPQRAWEERERSIYRSVYDASIRIDDDGTLVLPCLPGETLASVLEDSTLDESVRQRAIELAVVALAAFHRLGLTHGDAMAENVMVDLDHGAARWFDFETLHDPSRPLAWRRADDVRALVMTCLARTVSERRAATLGFILDVYADEGIAHVLATSFSWIWHRSLTFHLAQAALPVQTFSEIGRVLHERIAQQGSR